MAHRAFNKTDFDKLNAAHLDSKPKTSAMLPRWHDQHAHERTTRCVFAIVITESLGVISAAARAASRSILPSSPCTTGTTGEPNSIT